METMTREIKPGIIRTTVALKPQDISSELWREYDFDGRVYRIDLPKTLYVGTTSHRIVDINGITHCVPNIGLHGCVLRWQSKDASKPVEF